MEEKKKSNKKIIIIVITVLVLIILGIIAFIPVMQNNKKYNIAVKKYEDKEYEKAYNEFKQMGNYKNAEEYKDKCVLKAKEEIENNKNKAEYEKALNLCNFVSNLEDIAELKNEISNSYLKQLQEKGEYEKAYNLLSEYENVEEGVKQEVQQNYMIYLIENDNINKGMELLRNTEGLTEDNISKVLEKYIEKEIYPKAYNSLYNSMKNPSSLNVRDYSISVWHYNHDNPSEEGTKASSTYKKDFPYFKAEVKFNYSGTNSFGGVVTKKSLYAYWGKVNEDYTLSDVYLRWNY